MSEIEMLSPEERGYQAYGLRIQGKTWQEIAYTLGYDSASHARRAVNILLSQARDAITEEQRTEIINLELDRLDVLQTAFWSQALGGDNKSADTVLKIMMHRARLARLGDEAAASARTVIVTSEDYIARLKELSEE